MPIKPNRTANVRIFTPASKSTRGAVISAGDTGNPEGVGTWRSTSAGVVTAALAGIPTDGNSRVFTRVAGNDTCSALSMCLMGTLLPAPANPQPYILEVFVSALVAIHSSSQEEIPDNPSVFAWISNMPDSQVYTPSNTLSNDCLLYTSDAADE